MELEISKVTTGEFMKSLEDIQKTSKTCTVDVSELLRFAIFCQFFENKNGKKHY